MVSEREIINAGIRIRNEGISPKASDELQFLQDIALDLLARVKDLKERIEGTKEQIIDLSEKLEEREEKIEDLELEMDVTEHL